MAKTVRKSYKITFDVTVQVQDNVTEEMVEMDLDLAARSM